MFTVHLMSAVMDNNIEHRFATRHAQGKIQQQGRIVKMVNCLSSDQPQYRFTSFHQLAWDQDVFIPVESHGNGAALYYRMT